MLNALPASGAFVPPSLLSFGFGKQVTSHGYRTSSQNLFIRKTLPSMSDLTGIEKRKLERLLGMSSGYVLNFSNKTFEEFFFDSVGISIYDSKYDYGSGSKANRMRAFWNREGNHLVGKVLGSLIDGWEEYRSHDSPETPSEDVVQIIQRLQQSADVPLISVSNLDSDDPTFEVLARSVQQCIDRNEPRTGLDRLHTFLVKYLRNLCNKRGIDTPPTKPLHSLMGEYIKTLKAENAIDSAMTERILKSGISVLESFNDVRNDQSLAHDNQILNHDESLLIFRHIAGTVRFIEALEQRNQDSTESGSDLLKDTDIPF